MEGNENEKTVLEHFISLQRECSRRRGRGSRSSDGLEDTLSLTNKARAEAEKQRQRPSSLARKVTPLFPGLAALSGSRSPCATLNMYVDKNKI